MKNVSRKTCSVDGCIEPHSARGYCRSHYARARDQGEIEHQQQKGCAANDCTRPHYARGLCKMHYSQLRRRRAAAAPPQPRVCSVDGCERPHVAKGYCDYHYQSSPPRIAAHRKYQRERSAARRAAWVDANGPCVQCGSTENLEVDHIDPAEKEAAVGALWARSAEVRAAELAKCQVLCRSCHREKTRAYNLALAEQRIAAGWGPWNRALDKATVQRVRALAASGLSAAQVARELGVTRQVVKEIRSGTRYRNM